MVVVHVRDDNPIQAFNSKLFHATAEDIHESICTKVLLPCIDQQTFPASSNEIAVGPVEGK